MINDLISGGHFSNYGQNVFISLFEKTRWTFPTISQIHSENHLIPIIISTPFHTKIALRILFRERNWDTIYREGLLISNSQEVRDFWSRLYTRPADRQKAKAVTITNFITRWRSWIRSKKHWISPNKNSIVLSPRMSSGSTMFWIKHVLTLHVFFWAISCLIYSCTLARQ